MTQAKKLELCGSILTFLGGALLVIDTFSPVRELLLEGGRERWPLLLISKGIAILTKLLWKNYAAHL